uniref:Uncharacterized protein n=1 Tax=Chlamydomonas euryale TaxID=1486919 RepID=A0A7R9YZJ6_9CHLO|mmetsp:Transcript_35848/g.105981  ORF Transcript_35848/g.105981 Transcript_35848/m.105981 type:complete len:352 (+) Transcript_35848:73-1128(+)
MATVTCQAGGCSRRRVVRRRVKQQWQRARQAVALGGPIVLTRAPCCGACTVQMQLKERLGLLYSDTTRESAAVLYFAVSLVARDVAAGLLIGGQQGGGVQYGSTASKGLNLLLCLLYAAFAGWLVVLRPVDLPWLYIAAAAASLLEAASFAVVVWVCFEPASETAQLVVFVQALAVLALYTLLTWAALVALMWVVWRRWRRRDAQARAEDLEGLRIIRKELRMAKALVEHMGGDLEGVQDDAPRGAGGQRSAAGLCAPMRPLTYEEELVAAAERAAVEARELKRRLRTGEAVVKLTQPAVAFAERGAEGVAGLPPAAAAAEEAAAAASARVAWKDISPQGLGQNAVWGSRV